MWRQSRGDPHTRPKGTKPQAGTDSQTQQTAAAEEEGWEGWESAVSSGKVLQTEWINSEARERRQGTLFRTL